jgi:hypothetical protein
MGRNVVAAALQVVGLIVAVTASFALSVKLGALAAGVVVALVGLALEGER